LRKDWENMPWDLSDKRALKHDLSIILTLLLGSTIWICYIILSRINKVYKVKNWVSTKCVIDSIYVDVEHWSEPAIFFWNIHYNYTYNGLKYTSSRYNILRNQRIITNQEKERIKKEKDKYGLMHKPKGPYSPGDETICFVNPNNPAEAVINRKYTFTTFINRPLMAGVVIFIGSLLILITFIRAFHY
jgi:hypothetical protein